MLCIDPSQIRGGLWVSLQDDDIICLLSDDEDKVEAAVPAAALSASVVTASETVSSSSGEEDSEADSAALSSDMCDDRELHRPHHAVLPCRTSAPRTHHLGYALTFSAACLAA